MLYKNVLYKESNCIFCYKNVSFTRENVIIYFCNASSRKNKAIFKSESPFCSLSFVIFSVCLFVSIGMPVFLQFPVHMCVSLCLSVCLYFFLFSVCLSVYVCLSACLVVSLLTILHIHTSVWEPICLSACLPVYFVHPFQAILEEDENSHFLLFLWLNDCCIMQIQSATMLTPLSKQKCNELAEFFLANKWEC